MPLVETLSWPEGSPDSERYLWGLDITGADRRVFATPFRHDAVYSGHFKYNRRRITDYPNLWANLRDLYQQPGIRETGDLDFCKQHCCGSNETANPHWILPIEPAIDFSSLLCAESLS